MKSTHVIMAALMACVVSLNAGALQKEPLAEKVRKHGDLELALFPATPPVTLEQLVAASVLVARLHCKTGDAH
jgi:hypothetical protein